MADRRQLRAAADQVVIGRHGKRLDACGRAEFGDAAAYGVRRRRQRDDHGTHSEAAGPQRQFADRSQHADVAQQATLHPGVVVEQSHDAPLPTVGQLLGQAGAGLTRAQDQYGFAERGQRAVEPMLLPDAIGETASRHEKNHDRRVEDEHAARHDRGELQHHQHQRDRDGAKGCGEDDALQVGKTRKAPQTPIESEGEKDYGLQRQHPDQRAPHIGDLRLVQVEIEAQPIQTGPCDRGGGNVVQKRQPRSPVSTYFH